MTSFRLLERPTKKNSAAQMIKNATPPIAMPTMAPVESVCDPPELGGGGDDAEDVGAEVPEGEAKVDVASFGMGSPGATWKSAAAAAWTCEARVCVLLGFMTPTICSPIHEFGAAQ
jgi:hypothetical protein